jgi:hypothetical protein
MDMVRHPSNLHCRTPDGGASAGEISVELRQNLPPDERCTVFGGKNEMDVDL